MNRSRLGSVADVFFLPLLPYVVFQNSRLCSRVSGSRIVSLRIGGRRSACSDLRRIAFVFEAPYVLGLPETKKDEGDDQRDHAGGYVHKVAVDVDGTQLLSRGERHHAQQDRWQ